LRDEIYRQLKDADGFVSGGALGESFGVTRAALWKHIKAIQEDGAQIESVTGKGYKLIMPPKIPRAEYVRAHMRRDIPVLYEDQVKSTNDTAKIAARDMDLQSAVFIAGEQTAGKGRKGRTWVSKPGQGVYMTFLVRPKTDPEKISGITLAAAVAVCNAIEAVTDIKPLIKWPNDVIVDGKKAAGILTESMVNMDGVEFVVCGIGINTDASLFDEEIRDTAFALSANNTLLAAAEIDCFMDAYDTFVEHGLTPFMDVFRKRSALSGTVTVIGSGGSETGAIIGYDDDGAILLDCGGETKRFVAGEVSLRGEKGYV
jgi:BirA family biotin operon repressor/biotin-[acetyl-CoA-carboxylase] ligase